MNPLIHERPNHGNHPGAIVAVGCPEVVLVPLRGKVRREEATEDAKEEG
jgi:hypothetical protein